MILAAHVLVAVLIIVFVLLQRGKGAETGAAFGSGASGTVFGARGSANFLSRFTAVLAALFFASSLVLAGVGKPKPQESLLDTFEQTVPAEDEIPPDGYEEDQELPQLPSPEPEEQADAPQE